MNRTQIAEILAGLNPAGPPRLAFVRRAPSGLGDRPGTLLCLSASFNPLTAAHVGLIREARRRFPAHEILLLLAIANVDKVVDGLPLERRLDLLLRFTHVSGDVSVAATSHGRFVDKVDAIHRAYPADTRVIFLLGFDTLVRLFDPKYYTDREAALARFFSQTECAVANRGADAPDAAEVFLSQPHVSQFASRIHLMRLPTELAAVSATEVRGRLGRGEAIDELVPPEIRSSLEAWRLDSQGM